MAPLAVEGREVTVNRYFLNHPEMVLGTWTSKDTLYGGEGYSVTSNGDLAAKLKEAVGRLPRFETRQAAPIQERPAPVFIATAARAPHQRGKFLRRREQDHPSNRRRPGRPGRLWRHDAEV